MSRTQFPAWLRTGMAGFLVLIGLSIASARAEDADIDALHPAAIQVAYFSAVPFRESPFADLTGVHPITPDAAMWRNHYRFEYDASNRLVRVSFRLGNRVRDLNTSANYYFDAPRIDIAYEAGFERRRYFDRHGNPIAVQGTVFEAEFSLDALGYRRSLRYRDVHGQPVESDRGIALYTWQVSPDGTVIEHREAMDGTPAALRPGFPFYDIHLHYGAGGYLALMQNFGDGERLTLNPLNAAQDRLDFAANGDLRAWNVLDENGAPAVGNGPGVARGSLTYDSWGLQVSQSHENAAGEPMVSAYGWGVTRDRHDARGNTVWRGNFALDGTTPANNPTTGYSFYTYSYAENGRDMVELALFHADGSPAEHLRAGYSTRQQSYDAQGNVTDIVYRDARGSIVARQDTGESRRRLDYDANGRLTRIRLFGLDDTAISHFVEGWHKQVFHYVGDTGVVAHIDQTGLNGEEVAP